MDRPFAITLDVGTSLVNHTGSWRTVRPEYVHRLPPCNHACPAGEDIQGWLSYAENGDYEAAWRALTVNNPLPAVMGRVCYHPCESACNRAMLDSAVGINSVERFLGDLAIAEWLALRAACGQNRQKRAGRRCRALGPLRGLPPCTSRPCRHDQRGGTAAGRHDALRHSEIPPAARRARRRSRAHYRSRRRDQATIRRSPMCARQCRKAVSTLPFSPSAPTSPSARTFRPEKRRKFSMPFRCCARWKAKTSRCSAAASSSMAAATRRSMSRARRGVSARRRR